MRLTERRAFQPTRSASHFSSSRAGWVSVAYPNNEKLSIASPWFGLFAHVSCAFAHGTRLATTPGPFAARLIVRYAHLSPPAAHPAPNPMLARPCAGVWVKANQKINTDNATTAQPCRVGSAHHLKAGYAAFSNSPRLRHQNDKTGLTAGLIFHPAAISQKLKTWTYSS